MVRDLGGGRTLVNSAPVVEHDLANGDLITLGKFQLAVTLADDFSTGEATPGGVSSATMQGIEEAGRLSSLARPYGFLRDGAEDFALEALSTRIGAGEDCEIPLSGRFQPRVAVGIVRAETGYRAVEGSPKGGCLIRAGKRLRHTPLSEGDTLEIGKRSFTFHYGAIEDYAEG